MKRVNRLVMAVCFIGIIFYARISHAEWEVLIRVEGEDLGGVSVNEVAIGVGPAPQTLSAPPPPPDYSCFMTIYSSDLGSRLLKDIRATGQTEYCWIIAVNPHGNMGSSAPRSSMLSWDPSGFANGDYVLRKGQDCHGEIVVEDMKSETSLPVFGEEGDVPFTITWSFTNTEPAIIGNPPTEVIAGNEYSFVPESFDADQGDSLIFSIQNKPAWADFDMVTGRLSGIPETGDVGVFAGIVILATDTNGGSASLPPFDITVSAGDDPEDSPDDSGEPPEEEPDTDTDEKQNSAPEIPTLIYPGDGSMCESPTPELAAGEFADADGDTHAKTQWQVGADPVLSSIIFDETSAENLTKLKMVENVLEHDTGYYWRARFFDDKGNSSDWSAHYGFRTSSAGDANCNGIRDGQEVDDTADLDGNGQPDNYQADIKSIRSVNGDIQIGLKMGTNVKAIESLSSVGPDETGASANRPDELPHGLIEFTLTVENPGEQAEVVVWFSTSLPEDMGWYKYDAQTGWRDYSSHAVFSGDRRSVVLTFQDGGFGDADGVANGVIVDPSGPGRMNSAPEPAPVPESASEPATDGGDEEGGGGGGCFINVL